jgi:hypothetical protein
MLRLDDLDDTLIVSIGWTSGTPRRFSWLEHAKLL